MAARKTRKKTVSKKPAAKKAGSRVVKKDIRSLKKGLKKEIALTRKVSGRAKALSTKSKGHDRELELLRREIELLKKRKKRAGLSEYQRFMRTQIRAGLTFRQAARLWMKRKKVSAKKNRKRSSYNVFVSMQLKQGKTMKQAIRAWNLLKNPPKKKRRAKKKKQVKKRAVRRKLVKRRPSKRRIVVKRRVAVKKPFARKPLLKTAPFNEGRIAGLVESALGRVESRRLERVEQKVSSKTVSNEMPCDEGLALRMIDVYFGEVARYGLKRKLSLDEVVNAYFYCLMRVQRKGVEMNAVREMIGRQRA
jgi:hypothetical protein